jgi:hypothetical protein
MDIPLAGWLLSVLSFIAGTIVLVVYRRISYEGICFRQPADIRAVTQDTEQRKRRVVIFSAVVKVANAMKESAILEDISVDRIGMARLQFEPIGIDVNLLDPGTPIRIPPETEATGSNQLPALVKADSERMIVLGIWFRYTGDDPDDAVSVLTETIEKTGVRVLFRINGKDRSYALHAKPFERYTDHKTDA